ncbi:MAG: Crp/Fnr family transcriptional regulator [Actinomycetia bacterium]|nr:Crp/Fnr family transcriptional regulator [Actinomycetes bacterium]MCP4227341.1 Crp/Fnr family transcriptional regulator [Actinomycetes bacterium]MCP5031778.1 Crp/Fnr family transcriptional regulator [Actinomycetes bacterium]
MVRARPKLPSPVRLGGRLSQYGSWIACCLGRGPRAPLSENDVAELANEVGEQAFAGGTFVFRRGDPAARIHVLRSGTIELSRKINGRRVALQILRPGDVFGDVPAFLGEPEPFDAKAIEDCVILSLDTDALFTMLSTRPRVANRWFMSLAERMTGLQHRLIDLLAGSLESQLASILLREAGTEGEVRLTQANLAEMVGAPQSSVQRVLKSLETAGLIALKYRRIELVDAAGLLSLIDDEP